MLARDRIQFFENVISTFLHHAKERGYVIFAVLNDADQYVQFALRNGGVLGQVGSRQWCGRERPLSPVAVAGLARFGFTGGGPERNFAREDLTANAADLAQLADQLFHTAYELPEEFTPVIAEINPMDVTLPRAESFTHAMIERHLRAHAVSYLRDQDGDFRVDLQHDTSPGTATVWLIAEGPGTTLYRISGTFNGVAHSLDRVRALEHCNTWNRTHRWPRAFVHDDKDTWRFNLSADLNLGTGIHPPLFDDFTECAVGGILEFWRELAPSAEPKPPRRPTRRRKPD